MLALLYGQGSVRVGPKEGPGEPRKTRRPVRDSAVRFRRPPPRHRRRALPQLERRYYCFGLVESGVMTVRFTYRNDVIRIFGAGYWRKGKKIYERENQIYRRTSRKPQGHT